MYQRSAVQTTPCNHQSTLYNTVTLSTKFRPLTTMIASAQSVYDKSKKKN